MLQLNLTATFAVKIYHTNMWAKVPFVKEKQVVTRFFKRVRLFTPAVKTTLKGKKKKLEEHNKGGTD